VLAEHRAQRLDEIGRCLVALDGDREVAVREREHELEERAVGDDDVVDTSSVDLVSLAGQRQQRRVDE